MGCFQLPRWRICQRSPWKEHTAFVDEVRLGVTGAGVGAQHVAQGLRPFSPLPGCRAAEWLWQETYLLLTPGLSGFGRMTWRDVSECLLLVLTTRSHGVTRTEEMLQAEKLGLNVAPGCRVTSGQSLPGH